MNQAILTGFPTVPTDLRRPFFAGNVPNSSGFGGAFGWTQGIDYFCNCATNAYDSLQTKFTKRFSQGYSVQANYTLQRAIQDNPDYFFFDSEMNRGPADWDRTHNFTSRWSPNCRSGASAASCRTPHPWWTHSSAAGRSNTNTFIYSGLPFSVTYRDAGADRDTGGNNRPNLIGDPEGPKTKEQWFNATPIGSSGSAFERPARGTFGTMERNALRGPGYWRVDASLFKQFRFGGDALARGAHRGGEPVQQRQPRESGFGSRRARQPEPECRPDQLDGVRRQRPDAELPVRREVPVLRPANEGEPWTVSANLRPTPRLSFGAHRGGSRSCVLLVAC